MYPAFADPRLGLALVAGVPALVLAARSVVFPVVFAGLPTLLVGFLGHNPFPQGFVFAFLTGWLVLGLAFALLRDDAVGVFRGASVPIVLTAALAAWLLVRLQPGSYPFTKAEFFLAQSVPLLLAGIWIGRVGRRFDLFVVLSLAMALASALLLAKQLVSGSAQALYNGRFTVSVEDNPIYSGRQAAEGLLIATYLTFVARRHGARLASLCAIPLLAVSLLASGSRGPTLALVVGLVVLVILLLADPHRRVRLFAIAGGAIAAALLAPRLVPSQAVTRSVSFLLGNTADLSSNGRSDLWREAWHQFLANPLAGIGTGGFARLEPVLRYPHNILLEGAAELGVIGLALLVAFIAATLAAAIRLWRRSSGDLQIAAALLLALFATALVNAMLSDALEGSDTLWLLAGLIFGLRQQPSTAAVDLPERRDEPSGTARVARRPLPLRG